MGYREEFTELLGVDLVAKVKALALKFSTETVVVAPEAPTAEVKLEDVMLKDGTVLQVEKMEVGAMANIVTPEGVMPAADGEYVAENDTVIMVMGGLISEIKVAEIVEEVEVEEAPVVAGINSQLEAVTKRLADIEAKFESQTIELNETKKGLGVALSSVEKLTKQPVAISLEKQKPTSKRIEEMTELEKFRAYKSK
jgi:hypothetical protein